MKKVYQTEWFKKSLDIVSVIFIELEFAFVLGASVFEKATFYNIIWRLDRFVEWKSNFNSPK